MAAAAGKDDNVKHKTPHCHAPIHPAAPVPTPVPHPGKPLKIQSLTCPTVMVEGKEAATLGSMSEICSLPSCVPNGPGIVALGSFTVFHGGKPAARKGDMVAFAGCVAPIPGPIGDIQAPCRTSVVIGG